MTAPLLEVRNLRVEFETARGPITAVRGASLSVRAGQVIGLVGESASGKSVFLRSILRVLPQNGRIAGGSVRFGDRDLLGASEDEMRRVRGGLISLIPQDPVNAFNPALTVGYQMRRALKLHRDTEPSGGWNSGVLAMLARVGIHGEGALTRFPFNFSQGQLQRIMTCMAALAGNSRLLLADEPTTSLDVTIGAQILWLIAQLQKERGLAVIWVTHDLGVIAQLADRVAVMYAGTIVEEAATTELFAQPKHPYTIGLLRSAEGFTKRTSGRLYALPGAPPSPTQDRVGCPFAPRCAWATDVCRATEPELRTVGPDRTAACHHAESILASADR